MGLISLRLTSLLFEGVLDGIVQYGLDEFVLGWGRRDYSVWGRLACLRVG